MNIRKSPLAGTSGQPSLEELALINQMSQRTLAAEEVYTFGVRLCDNQVDRDGERFPRETLEELAPCLWARAGFLTTTGPPKARPPGFTGLSWFWRMAY